jgi:alpha-aminoadipate carrier protein LysW
MSILLGWAGNFRWRKLLMAVVCPECDNPLTIDVDEVEAGEVISCDECGTELEVVSSDPLELAPVDEEGYDEEDAGFAADADEEDEDE